jgi:DNA polymerase-1
LEELHKFIPMLTDIYLPGILIDEERLEQIDIKYTNLLDELLLEICELDKRFEGVNIRSPGDISEYLYVIRGFIYYKKEFRSTKADALNYLAIKYEDPIILMIKRAREVAHFLDSFVHSIMDNAVNGRIHTNINQFRTTTTRWASSDPNLQQQPSRGDFGEFKEIFIADPGFSFVQSDYQQLEFRVAAFHCNDANMISFIREGRDIHRYMASLIYNKTEDVVTKDERTKSKTGTFGKIYRQTPSGLAARLNIPKTEAQAIHKIFDRLFPGWEPFNREVIAKVLRDGYVESYFGRIRRFPYITKSNEYKVFNEAVNFPIQCDGHVICSRAAYNMWQRLSTYANESVGIRNVVHDSILVQVPDGMVYDTVAMHKEIMETQLGDVPILIDTEIGKSWGNMTTVK